MGLIKAIGDVVGGGLNAVGGAFNSGLWTEYFESGDMSGGILMKRGEKILGEKSKNKRADDNLISSGSGIDIQEGQCMIMVENGRIVEFCAEPGRYTFDASSAPSLLCGQNKGLKAFGSEILNQWKAGGQRFSTQRVYFINLGEIITKPILWGSGNITFQHIETDINDNPVWKISTTLQGNGNFTVAISDPVKFFKEIGAQKTGTDGDGIFRISDIETNLKSDVIGKVRQAVGALSSLKIPYTDIANHESDIIKNLNELLDGEWTGMRGIEVRSFNIIMLDASQADKNKINEYQETVGYAANPAMANVNIQRTMAEGIKSAGENGGAASIVGLGMGMGAVGGAGLGQLNFAPNQPAPAAQPAQSAAPAAAANPNEWVCSCGCKNTSKFCSNCGSAKPVPEASGVWKCSCGAECTGKFCPECGSAKPQVKKYKCNKCGWTPEDPTNPPKFCPECGDVFDENDAQ